MPSRGLCTLRMRFNFETLERAPITQGTCVFLTIDLNVPLVSGEVADAYRITRARRTLTFLKERGARTLLVSHRTAADETLRPVFEYLKKEFSVVFAESVAEARTRLETASEGSFVLLENIRRFAGETENSEPFAKDLASLAEVYVNEAFSASHRAHASIVGVPKFLPHYAGFLFEEEVRNLSKAFSPAHPFLFILGGAKFETKLPLIQKFLLRADTLYIGGALANDIYKARGIEVRDSLVSNGAISTLLAHHPKVRVPADMVWREEKIVDAGERAVSELAALVTGAAFILWNGPLGAYSGVDYGAATQALARAIAGSSVESIIGGGDTIAAVAQLGILEKFSFVSTGGGAMLQFLADGTLPGIEALR